jgi:serine/threonine-protein kinase
MQQMVKERIGRHEVICPLGEGGMAEVYLGFSRGPADVNKLVVMKRIRSELARDKRFVTMFLDEARLATRLNHPNVVHTYEVLEDAGQYILTMEYLEGQSLFDVFQRIDLQYFPLDLHLWILTQVLAGLQYAHALPDYNGSPLGVVHRDVSPENTFVTYNGDVKLLDFGIAKAGGAVSVTNRGTFKGKLGYCAPEQLEGDESPDARADIFAVGVMLWEALAGKRIEVGETCAQMAQTRLTGREPRIRSIRPDVAPALAEMCDRAMALAPAERYMSAVDFQRDLERYLEESGKRVGRAQLAELMRGHFELERRFMRKRIQEHLLTSNNLPVAVRESMSGTSREGRPLGSRHRVTALAGSGPRMFRNLEVKTQETTSPPFMWASKSAVLPETLATPVLPLSHEPVPTGPRRFSGGRLLVLAAVLVGGSAAALASWKRFSEAAVSAPAPRTAPAAVASMVKPSEAPRPPLATIPVLAAAPVPETVQRAPLAEAENLRADDANRAVQPLRAFLPGVDGHPNPRHPRAPVRVGKKPHPPQVGRKPARGSKPEPTPSESRPLPRPLAVPGMDLDAPFSERPVAPIDDSNPYAQ